MADGEESGFRVEMLQEIARAVDPAAVLLPDRLMRRAIRNDPGLAAVGLRVPHRDCYPMDGHAAAEVLGRWRLGLGAADEPPATVLLIARPAADVLAGMPRAVALTMLWRRLFHARVHTAIAARGLNAGDVDGRIGRIGVVEFDEIREVLRQEGVLLPPRDDRAAFEEFAAHYLELRHFAASLLPAEFPGIGDFTRVDELLAADVDAPALLAGTRPPGAPDPLARRDDEARVATGGPSPAGRPIRQALAEGLRRGWLHDADVAAAKGNSARAAILRSRAAGQDSGRPAAKARAAARAELDRLGGRLRSALTLDGDETRRWRGALPALLDAASGGGWTAEARLLFDLQKVCVDHERDVSTVDLVEWALTFGRRPVVRTLPNQRLVLISKHLRSAARRLPATRLSEPDRRRLDGLLRDAIHGAEDRLRERLRPLIGEALSRTGLVPANLPERVAFRKLVEELLDRVVERGFLAMGDLRDALSRSNLKLPDLAGPGELLVGDRLLKADRNLAVALDGVYRRGEVYLRGLQKLSSLAFGTAIGRFLTRFGALPFGGAFVVLEGLQHLVGFVVPVRLVNPVSLISVGLFLLGVLHSWEFRGATATVFRAIGKGFRAALIGGPAWLLRRAIVRRLVGSRAFAVAWNWGLRPLVPSAIVGLTLRALGLGHPWSDALGASVFVGAALVLNSRAGQDLEEVLTDAAVHGWHHLRDNLVPGLYRLVMEASARALEAIDRALYTVDEWLRFRNGQGRLTLASKALLGIAWFFVVYAIRFCVTLLIEPQVNPVKHFPVVTVSHKIIFPMSFRLLALLKTVIPDVAEEVTAVTVLLLPGVFGFLVWELKENWRLYEANRPSGLRPVVIGHHGETMARLLRPGFHSGTIPKIFSRLRHAGREALRVGRRKAALKQWVALDHAEEAIRHFIDRDVVALLQDGRDAPWIEAGEIALATNRIRVELRRPGKPEDTLEIAFEERSGALVAGIEGACRLGGLGPERLWRLALALDGLFKMAGVDLIRGPSPADLWGMGGSEALPIPDLIPAPVRETPDPRDGPLSWRRWVALWDIDGPS